MISNIIDLTETSVFNNGCHKKVYYHPNNKNWCIKIPYNEEGRDDIKKELFIRERLNKKNITSKILPKYFGIVKTNLGDGYVFELIKDYNDNISMTLEDYLNNEEIFIEKYPEILENISFLKKQLFEENLIIMALFPGNIILQHFYPGKLRPILVNDLGSSALIPLEYFFDYFNRKRTTRRWSRFINYIASHHHYSQAQKFVNALK